MKSETNNLRTKYHELESRVNSSTQQASNDPNIQYRSQGAGPQHNDTRAAHPSNLYNQQPANHQNQPHRLESQVYSNNIALDNDSLSREQSNEDQAVGVMVAQPHHRRNLAGVNNMAAVL